MRLFASVLTEQQIRETMNSPLHGREDSLAAHWDMQAGSGPFLFDASGHGNNGTLQRSASSRAVCLRPKARICAAVTADLSRVWAAGSRPSSGRSSR